MICKFCEGVTRSVNAHTKYKLRIRIYLCSFAIVTFLVVLVSLSSFISRCRLELLSLSEDLECTLPMHADLYIIVVILEIGICTNKETRLR